MFSYHDIASRSAKHVVLNMWGLRFSRSEDDEIRGFGTVYARRLVLSSGRNMLSSSPGPNNNIILYQIFQCNEIHRSGSLRGFENRRKWDSIRLKMHLTEISCEDAKFIDVSLPTTQERFWPMYIFNFLRPEFL
jgi:hypothetical protein